MVNPWFRMYSEFSHDPKVQMMSEQMQRRYIMLMCLRCSNTLVTLHETEVAFHLRITVTEFEETKALFIEKGFIDSDLNLLNWEKRQFASDTSNARVAKHRALQKEKQAKDGNTDVTLRKRKSNALDTDTDTDTEKKEIQGAVAPIVPAWVPKDAWAGYVEMRRKCKKPLTDRGMRLKIAALEKFKASGFDVSEILDQSTANDWTDLYAPKGVKPRNGHKQWVSDAGFTNEAEANNELCFERNAHEFHGGKRIAVAA